MTTVADLAKRVKLITDTLYTLNTNITTAYTAYFTNLSNTTSHITLNQNQVNEMTAKRDSYDRMFQEEQIKYQNGKSRHQTLQEYVLLFFFVAYGVFTVSLALMTFTTEGQSASLKIIGAMIFCFILISGTIIRYA